MSSVAVIVAGGDSISANVLEELPGDRWVIAADSGLDHALAIGLEVNDLVGDLDSVSDQALRASPHLRVERYPPDKDATDLELAMARAGGDPNVDRVLVLGGLGGRLDHLLSNASVLASTRWAHLEVDWIAGRARVAIVHDHRRLHGSIGEKVSLLPYGGPASGVSTAGLRWPLENETLEPGSSLGVSNEFVLPVAAVTIRSGVLLAIQPDALTPS